MYMLLPFAVFVVTLLFMAVALSFYYEYQEKKRLMAYQSKLKFRRKPLNITDGELERVGKFWREWEEYKKEVINNGN